MTNYNRRDICALIVIYDPKIVLLRKTINSLKNSVDKIFIYKNSETPETILDGLSNIEVLGTGLNVGLAKAQNRLLQRAKEREYKFALLSDQDTIYPNLFFQNLIPLFDTNAKIIAVAPGWTNIFEDLKFNGFHVFDIKGALKHVYPREEPIAISHAISSGLIINISLIEKVGLFDEDLFIDWLDNDWCWRANNLGYQILGDPKTIIKHQLGEKSILILKRHFTLRSSLRNYFIIRNAIILIKKHKTIPLRKYLILKIIHHIFFSILTSQQKLNDLKILYKSFFDGILGNLDNAPNIKK